MAGLRRLFAMAWSETALLSAVSLANLAITVSALQPADLGLVALWMSVASLAGLAIERGLGDQLTVRWLQLRSGLRPAVAASYAQGMVPGLALATIAGLAAGIVEPFAILATLQVWAFVLYRIALFQMLVHRSLGRQMAMHLAIEGSRSIWLLLLLHLAVPRLGLTSAAAVLAAYPASHLVLLAFFACDRTHFPLHLPRRLLPRSPLRRLVRDRFRLAVTVSKNFADALPLWLLGLGASIHDAGLFSVVQRLAAFPYGFLRRAETLLMVHFCADLRSGEFRRASMVQIAVAVALAVASAVAALGAIQLFPVQYHPALDLFAIYVAVLVPMALTGALRSRLMATGDYRTLAIHYTIGLAVMTAAISGTLLLGGGLVAVVLATIAGYAIGSGTLFLLSLHRRRSLPSGTGAECA